MPKSKISKPIQATPPEPITPSGVGRPSKFTDEVKQRILEAVGMGASIAAAAAHAGVAGGTVWAWMKQGKQEGEGEFFEFYEALTRARDKAELAAITAFRSGLVAANEVATKTEEFVETRIGKDGEPYTYRRTRTTRTELKRPPDWRAGLAWLERRHPDRWIAKTQTEISGRGGNPIEIRAIDYRQGLESVKPDEE